PSSDIEAEEHDVSVLHGVPSTLRPKNPAIPRLLPRPHPLELVNVDRLRADEPPFEVRVDGAGGLRRSAATRNGPRTALVLAGREERGERQEVVGGADQPVEPGLGEPQVLEEEQPLGLVELRELGLDGAAN